MNYYNEFDPYAAQWLRNLIAEKLIPDGEVDERSIAEVKPGDLKGFIQCHFFTGIGGWPLALQLAGWPATRPVWTGSCPCQPYSVAGKQEGQADERDLWPVWNPLIAALEPPVIFGEQVAAAVGKDWLDRVRVDLEAKGYALGAAVLPACAVDAPHRRDRLWFVANAERGERGGRAEQPERSEEGGIVVGRLGEGIEPPSDSSLANAEGSGSGAGFRQGGPERNRFELGDRGGNGDVADTTGGGQRADRGPQEERRLDSGGYIDLGNAGGLVGNPLLEGLERHPGDGDRGDQPGRLNSIEDGPIAPASAWRGAQWLLGADGKARRFEPAIRLLAHGVPARVGKLRAFGNAIVPELAAEFIGAFMELEQ